MNHALLSPATRRRLSVAVVGLALLAGSATPAQADHHTPEPALLPFAATSPWRLGIAETATFAPSSDARNVAIADVDASGAAWVNSGRYSHPVARATGTTPFASMTDSFHSLKGVPQGGTWQEQIPAEARIADGTDRHMHVITADGQHVQEHFGTTRVSPTEYTTKRRHQVSLTGSGIGPQNGTRAYGGSAIGGLIRAWEVDPTHPQYTGSIEHPLAVALRADQLYYAGVTLAQDGYGATYNRYGYGLAQGYVWPATEQDSDSRWSYSGVIPMGSYFAIPPEVDIASLGLQTPEARMLAEAAQDYGVYVTDRSGSSAFYVEDDGGAATAAFAKALIGPSYTATEVKRVFKALRVVEGNSASAPNGGPLGVERRGDLDDPAPATGEVLLPGYTEPTTTTTPTPAPSPTTTAPTTTAPTTGYAAKVRFQTATATPPAGYLADWGQPYGTRTGSTQGTGLAYGWVQAATGAPVDLTKNGRVRTGTTTTDQRLTGIMHMDWQTTAGTSGTAIPGAWELAVPNGTYTVTVAVGDAGNHYDSLHHLNIEGVTAVSAFTGTSANRFATATRTVAVTDGRLTLTQTGGRNTKLAYVDVATALGA